MPLRRPNGWASWQARSPCPTISTAWAKPRSRPCSGTGREAPVRHPAPALGGRRARAAARGGAQASRRSAQRAALQRRQPVGDRHQELPGPGRLPRRAAPAAPRSARQRLRRASHHQPARGEHRQLASPAQGSLRPPAAGPGPQRGHDPPHRRRATGPLPRARAQGVGDRQYCSTGVIAMALLTGRFQDALGYAAELHAEQKRKGSEIPYVSHLLGVAALVIEAGGDEDEAIAALLHDAVEDQGGAPTREAIRQRYGDRVAAIVVGCTDTDIIPKPPWRQRKEQYVEHIRHAPAEVCRVSVADKLHNARAILADLRRDGASTFQRFNGGRDGTLWYYRALYEAFREAGTNPMVDELGRVVEQMERLNAADGTL